MTFFHIQHLILDISLPADDTAPNNAWSSAGPVLFPKLEILPSNFLWLLMGLVNFFFAKHDFEWPQKSYEISLFCKHSPHKLSHHCVYIFPSHIFSRPSACTTKHYTDVIMGKMVSQITSLTIVYSTVYSGTDQRKHQSSASQAIVRGIHRWLVNSPQKWPV